ncbi:MAG: pantoate--beta-alanine ligase [Candidatus Omnitrophota bacterium]|jgi:pantoate--beta-alanine ligase
MIIIKKIKKMAAFSRELRHRGCSIGFVPTMGALHQGHLSLIQKARRECDKVVVSIFVNPAQFGPKEDFKKYPRVFPRDVRLCRKAGVDAVFYPDAKEMYPDNYKTYILVSDLSDVLCGKFRPGHFKGVATVVAKLFNIVQPDTAYFGQKDAQQAVIIGKMALDLNLPVKIKIMPTWREKDGLAMSSRNLYLSKEERKEAPVLFQSLNLAEGLIGSGISSTDKIIRAMKAIIGEKKSAKIDYISVVDLENLKPLRRVTGRCLVALAAWIGRTRLIDNIIIRR